jgi:hypothetical protein
MASVIKSRNLSKRYNLVGGCPTPLKNMSSSVRVTTPIIWENKEKSSKPPKDITDVNPT